MPERVSDHRIDGSTMWLLGIELRLSGKIASALFFFFFFGFFVIGFLAFPDLTFYHRLSSRSKLRLPLPPECGV